MDLQKIYTDSDFENAVVPAGQILLFAGLDENGKPVTRYKDSAGNFGTITGKGGSAGGESAGCVYYMCDSIDVSLNTWKGYKAVLTDGVYIFEETLTSDTLTFGTGFQPKKGAIYNADATVTISSLWQGEDIPLTLTAEADGSTVTLNTSGSPTTSGVMYRLDQYGTWSPYTVGTTITLAETGDYVQFKNTNNTFSVDFSNHFKFSMNGTISGSGNIQSLLNWQTTCPDNCFIYLFEDCSALISAPDLPATSIGYRSYYNMFRSTSVVSAVIQATDVSAEESYANMFQYDSKLTDLTVNFTSWETSSRWWVEGVASGGTFTKPSSLPEEFSAHRIPSGWTVVNAD